MDDDDKLITFKELKSVFGIPYCRQHIARLEDAGEFPTRIQLGKCRVAWLKKAVRDWIRSRSPAF